MADRLSRFQTLEKTGEIDPKKFNFIKLDKVKEIVNEVCKDLLNEKRVPKNTSTDDEF